MIEEMVFMCLRMNEGINRIDFKNRFKIEFCDKYQKQVEDLVERGLLLVDEKSVRLTQKGREISNSVFLEILS